MNRELSEAVAGGGDLLAWFEGRVPSVHDAEVVALQLDRDKTSCHVKIHAFEMTGGGDKGQYVFTKHVVVRFELENVTALSLTDFNHQNVIYGVSITQMPNGEFCLEVEPCGGLSGEIKARTLRIALEPGVPPGSIYSSNCI